MAAVSRSATSYPVGTLGEAQRAGRFQLRNIPFVAQVPCQIHYKGHPLTGFDRIDFICFDAVVVEVKAVSATTPADEAQILNYLALSGRRVGVLLNFGQRSLEHKRFVLDLEKE